MWEQTGGIESEQKKQWALDTAPPPAKEEEEEQEDDVDIIPKFLVPTFRQLKTKKTA